MKKYYCLLFAALMLLTSCAPDPTVMPMSQVPIGIMFLAIVGVIAIILLLFAFILLFGGLIEGNSKN